MDDVTTTVVAVATTSVMVTVGATVMVDIGDEVVVVDVVAAKSIESRFCRRAGASVSSHMPSALRYVMKQSSMSTSSGHPLCTSSPEACQ